MRDKENLVKNKNGKIDFQEHVQNANKKVYDHHTGIEHQFPKIEVLTRKFTIKKVKTANWKPTRLQHVAAYQAVSQLNKALGPHDGQTVRHAQELHEQVQGFK